MSIYSTSAKRVLVSCTCELLLYLKKDLLKVRKLSMKIEIVGC